MDIDTSVTAGHVIMEQPSGGHFPASGLGVMPMIMPMGRMNSENAIHCPPGMETLLHTSLVMVRQIVEMLEVFSGFDTNNRYEVLDMGGRRLFLAAEQSDCCTRYCMGNRRPFTVLVLDNRGGICLKVKRKCTCCFFMCGGACCNELDIYTGTDLLLGKITQNFCDCLCPRFTIWDADDKKQLKIRGPCNCCLCCTVHFKVHNMEGQEIGEIHKKWGGMVKEWMTTADTFGVSFPQDLDPRLKTLLVAAVFLIDFMFFEKGGGSSN